MSGDPYTLIVATNSKGEAVGRVYNDDTKTFNYQKGDMMYRELKLSNNQLTNRIISGSYVSPEVERIVILGVGKHTATLNGEFLLCVVKDCQSIGLTLFSFLSNKRVRTVVRALA
eukprot:sb/3476750/